MGWFVHCFYHSFFSIGEALLVFSYVGTISSGDTNFVTVYSSALGLVDGRAAVRVHLSF
jgi:hypothetical protein